MNYYKRNEISNSDLKYLSISVKHLLNARQEPKKSTPEQDFGSLVHTLILEPEKFNDNFIIEPEFNKRTKQGKADYNEFLMTNDKIIVDEVQLVKATEIANNLKRNERYRQILDTNLEVEKEVYFNQFGVDCRSKLDLVNETHIFDLKTIDDISDAGIKKNIYNFKYYRQMAFYVNAMNKERLFTFIFLEKKAPYSIRYIDLGLYNREMTFYDKGNEEIEQCLTKWREYQFNELEYLDFTSDTQTLNINEFN